MLALGMLLRRALGLVVGAAMVVSAWAHGYMMEPISRNVGASDCPHCLDGGGVGQVYANGRRWPNGNFGVCGDPPSGERAGYHLGGGEFERKVGIRVTSYRAGDTIVTASKLTANHWGFFEFFLCKLPDSSAGGKDEAKHLTNACFSTRLAVQQDGAWGDRFYVGDKTGDFSIKVRLPDMVCKRCVMRWLYTTGNSCTAPGTPSKWAVPKLQTCGQDGANPELFLNCADVALLKDGSQPSQSTVIKPPVSEGVQQPADPPPTGNPPPPTTTTTSTGTATRRAIPLQPGEVLVSVAVAGAFGMPLLLVSPALGLAGGLCACIALLVLFTLINVSKKK